MPTPVGRIGAGRTGVVGALALATVLVLPGVARTAPGDRDPGFGGSSHGRVAFEMGAITGLALQPNGGLVTVGYSVDATSVHAVVRRFRADGRPDPRFGTTILPGGPRGDAEALAAVAQPDGKIVVAGDVPGAGGFDDIAVWRLKASGAVDSSFGGGGLVQLGTAASTDLARDVAVDGHGRVVVVGSTDNGDSDIVVARLTASGDPDPAFDAGGTFVLQHPGLDAARSVALAPHGKIVVGGQFQGVTGNAVLRITPGDAVTRATLDASFGGGDGVADVDNSQPSQTPDVAVTSDGRPVVLETTPALSGVAGDLDSTVVRLTSDGFADKTFGAAGGTGARISLPGVNNVSAAALSMMPDGGVVVAGTVFDSGQRSFVAKFRADGRPDRRMDAGGVTLMRRDEELSAVAPLSDGRILTAGNFGDAGSHAVVYRLLGDLRAPSCGGRKATIVGTRTRDLLVGTRRRDVITGLGGGDTITGLGNDDILCGGAGRDHLLGGFGNDRLIGGPGHDLLRGGPGRDVRTP